MKRINVTYETGPAPARAGEPHTPGPTASRHSGGGASRLWCWLAVGLLARGAQADLLHDDLASVFTARNATISLAGLGVAGVMRMWDDDVEREFQTVSFLEAPSRVTDIYGSSVFNVAVSLGLWGAGRLMHRDRLAATGETLLRTLTVTQLVVAPIKVAVGRRRPDGSNRLSFPSGHTANSFAVAGVLHRSFGRRVGIPLYGLSVLVAAGRIEGRRHFLSDVTMGAVLGTVVGHSITLGTGSKLQVRPAFAGGGLQLRLKLRI